MFKVHNKTTKSDQLDNSKSFALTVRCDAIQWLLKALMTTHTHHEVTKRIIMCHCGQLLFLSSNDRPVQSLDLAASQLLLVRHLGSKTDAHTSCYPAFTGTKTIGCSV